MFLSHNLWECACGEGHLSEILKKNGYSVLSTDLIDRGYADKINDFLKSKTTYDGDIITNPPFKYADKFVEKAMELLEPNKKLILFLKIQFLESKSRYELFKKYPPKYIYVHSSRQMIAKNGEFEKYSSSALCYAWFIWENGNTQEPVIRWIE